MDTAALDRFQASLTTAKNLLIVLPQQLTYDKVAAALAWYLALKKTDKTVSVCCSQNMTVEYSSLVGVDKITNQLGGNNLIVSFAYEEDSIEKVSYNIENKLFNLVIQPKVGFAPLSPDKVKYTTGGGQADLVFVFGTTNLADLAQLYTDNKELFNPDKLAFIDLVGSSLPSTSHALLDDHASSYGELVASLIYRLQLPPDQDIATNLLAGLEDATANFSSSKVTADTFEAAAFCLRSGGVRHKATNSTPAPAPLTTPPAPTTSAPSPDWFEPKIFKGNTQV